MKINKGKISTVIGSLIAVIASSKSIVIFISNGFLNNQELISYAVFMAISFIAIILPSEIEIETKLGSIKMKD